QSSDLAEDRISRGGPDEQSGGQVVALAVTLDASDQAGNAIQGTTPDGLLGNQAEPALDLIEPRRIGGDEVHVVTRPARQPGAHLAQLSLVTGGSPAFHHDPK